MENIDFYIYRNFTVENLFQGINAAFSAYGDISYFPEDVKQYVWFYLPQIKMNQHELVDEIVDFESKFDLFFNQVPKHKNVIAFTIDNLFTLNFEGANNDSYEAVLHYNYFLLKKAKEHANIKVLRIEEFIREVNQPLLDWKYYYISQSFISPKFNAPFKRWFLKKVEAIAGIRKKCLVLDLDNTLWGGIVGEDGVDGIKIGDTYPGAAFRDFQLGLIEAAGNGVILAVCSKNNLEDVEEVWEKHPFQLIKQKQISAYRINWQDKGTNIQELADELNIGLDSFVFIDDNPIERERVKQMLPMVTVPDFPEHPYQLPSFLKEVYEKYFQIHQLTKEDREKTKQYSANVERTLLKKTFTSVDDYLSSLEMELRIIYADSFSIPRISQMTQKTNQFNLTTRRYSESDIHEIVKNNGLVSCLSVADKFGDNGITVASVIKRKGESAEIDSFLLSCRILGRNIETAYLTYLINRLFDEGITILKATYIPSQKNKQTEFFYENNGFTLDAVNNGVKEYSLHIEKKIDIKSYYKFV